MSPPIPPSGAPEAVPSAVPAEEPKPLIASDTAAMAAALPDPPIALPALSDSAPSSAGAVAEAAAAAVAASPPPPPVAGADAVGAAGGGGGTPAADTGVGATMPATAVASIAPLGGVPATTAPAPAGGDETQFATHAVLIQQQQQIHSLEVQLASSQAEIARLRRIARGGPAAMPSFGTSPVAGPLVGVGGAAALGFPVGAASPATGLPPEPAPPPPVVLGLPAGVPLGGGAPSIAANVTPTSGALSLPSAPPTGDLRPDGARGPAASSPSLMVSAALSMPSTTGGLPSSAPSPLQPPAGVPAPQATAAAASRAGPTTAAVPAGSAAVTPGTGGAAAATTAAAAAPATVAATPAPAGAAAGGAKKGGTSRYWTAEEHARFLDGLRQFGAKDIKGIARHVGSRSATQVRTHQQKYNLRLLREKEKANSAGGGSASAPVAGTGGAAGAASSSSTPLPGAHRGGSHAGGNTASSAGAAGARRVAGAAAAANASTTEVAVSAASAGKDAKPSVALSPGTAAGRGTAHAAAASSGVVAPPGSRYAGISPPGAAARAAGATGQAATTAAAAAAAPFATDKRPGGVMARKGQSPKRSRAGKRARSSSAPVAHTPAGGALPGAAGASASQELPVRSGNAVVAAALGMTPTGAGLAVTPNGGPAASASSKETAMPSAAGGLVVRDEAVASGEVGADGSVKVHGGGDNLGGTGAVGGLDEAQAELLLGGRPPLRRSGSSSVLLSELPFLQRPLISSSGFALPRTGTGAICSTAGPAGVGAAGGAGAAGSSSAAAAASGTAAGLPSATVRRSNSVLSLLSGMPTLRGLAESPSSERLLGLVPPELNDVDGSHVYRNGGPALSMAGAGVGGSSGGLGFGIGVAPSSDHAPYVVGSFDHLAGLSAVEDLEEPQAVAMQLQDAKWS